MLLAVITFFMLMPASVLGEAAVRSGGFHRHFVAEAHVAALQTEDLGPGQRQEGQKGGQRFRKGLHVGGESTWNRAWKSTRI